MPSQPVRVDELRGFEAAVALVTGGASGIGRALGRALARRGAHVILADRQGDEAAAAAAQLRGEGGKAEAAALDVRDAAAVAATIDGVFTRHGRLDYLFNNAGIAISDEVQAIQLDEWRQSVEVNLMGVIHGVVAAYPRLRRQGFGHIVNTASMAGLSSTPMNAAYGATKHAVVSLSRSLRIEAKESGVRVSVLCPGVIRTPLLDGGRFGRDMSGAARGALREQHERLRPMDPDRFAERALDAVRDNRGLIILPRAWWLLYWIERLSPSLVDWLATIGVRQLRARRGTAPPPGDYPA